MNGPTRVLVLCNGNIGRSPLAAALLENALATELGVPSSGLSGAGFEIASAGIEAPEGHPASRRGRAYAARLGINLDDHSSTLLTAEELEAADLIYAMDGAQIDGVGRLVPGAEHRVIMWEGEGREIPDPHHESDAFFVAVADRIVAVLPQRVREVLSFPTTATG